MIYIAQSLVAIDARGAKLTWDPVSADDFAGYEVYEERAGQRIKLHPGLLAEPVFRTGELRFGLHRFWIAAVDTNGNRSWSFIEVIR